MTAYCIFHGLHGSLWMHTAQRHSLWLCCTSHSMFLQSLLEFFWHFLYFPVWPCSSPTAQWLHWSINTSTRDFKIQVNRTSEGFSNQSTLLHFPLHSSPSHMFHSSFNKVHWFNSSIGRSNWSGGGVVYSLAACFLFSFSHGHKKS